MQRWVLAAALIAGSLGAPAAANGLRLEGHGGPVKGVAVSADGSRALTASFDYSVGIWSVEEGRLIAWAEGHEAAANAVAFHPDGRILSVGDDFDLILWSAEGALLQRFEGHQGKLLAVALSPDGRMAATAGWDGAIGLWDLDTGASAGWLRGHKANVNDVVFSPDGAVLYSASYDGTIRVWDLAEQAERETLVSHGFGINRMVLGAGWLAYGAVDGAVRVLDLATRETLADLTADRRPILALAMTPEGDQLAVGDGEGHIMVIDTADWSIARDFRAAARGPIWALAWDGDGRVLAGGLADEAAFWPVTSDGGSLFAEGERHFQRDPSEMSNGERQFVRKCAVCHTLDPDGARRAGPSLHGVFGRRAGSLPGYRYSPALTGLDMIWNAETIDRLFAEGPDHVTPGSKMPMQQIAKPSDRADLIAFLRANTASSGASGGQTE
ncbi:MAG: c-type cytochrome [Pseudomonadota bacterium]